MRRGLWTATTALLLAATLSAFQGCSRAAPVLRGDETLYVARRVKGLDLRVELQKGQEERDIHDEGWYVSGAQMSRIFALLGEKEEDEE